MENPQFAIDSTQFGFGSFYFLFCFEFSLNIVRFTHLTINEEKNRSFSPSEIFFFFSAAQSLLPSIVRWFFFSNENFLFYPRLKSRNRSRNTTKDKENEKKKWIKIVGKTSKTLFFLFVCIVFVLILTFINLNSSLCIASKMRSIRW